MDWNAFNEYVYDKGVDRTSKCKRTRLHTSAQIQRVQAQKVPPSTTWNENNINIVKIINTFLNSYSF